MEPSIVAFREDLHFPAQKRIYLNHAAVSPTTQFVNKAIETEIKTRSESDPENLNVLLSKMDASRKILARWMQIEEFNRIGFVNNVSTAITLIVNSLDWNSDDEILVNDREFPSNKRPYESLISKGVRIVSVGNQQGAVRANDIRNAITKHTKLVALSAVQFLSGFKADLSSIGEICQKNGILFLVDSIQALGHAPINQSEINADFIVGGCHKWLMGPTGLGYCYISEQGEHAMKTKPIGWLNYESPWNLFAQEISLLKGGRLLELGGISSLNVAALYASLRQFDTIGLDSILMYTGQWGAYLRSRLTKTGAVFGDFKDDERSAITSLYLGKRADEVHQTLKANNIDTAVREGYLRLSPHFYHNESEIEVAATTILQAL